MITLTPNAISHATLAVWGSLALAGWAGRASVAVPTPAAAPAAAVPPVVETLALRLETEPRHEPGTAGEAPAEAPDTRPPTTGEQAPEAPAPVAVAPPGATPAFAVAVRGPVTYAATAAGAAADARRVAGTGAGVRTAAPVETLAFGTGAGAQPAPAYPREARRKGWEGDVTVRFSVNADGTVAETRVVAPSPWAALDAAATDTIRTRWRFAPGRTHLYEITIRFRLSR